MLPCSAAGVWCAVVMTGVHGAHKPEGWLNDGWKTLVVDVAEFHMPDDSVLLSTPTGITTPNAANAAAAAAAGGAKPAAGALPATPKPAGAGAATPAASDKPHTDEETAKLAGIDDRRDVAATHHTPLHDMTKSHKCAAGSAAFNCSLGWRLLRRVYCTVTVDSKTLKSKETPASFGVFNDRMEFELLSTTQFIEVA